jgi:hypothetical protein
VGLPLTKLHTPSYCPYMASNSRGWEIGPWYFDPWGGRERPWAEVRNAAEWPAYCFRLDFDDDLTLKGFSVSLETAHALTRERLREVPLGEMVTAARAFLQEWWAQFDQGRGDAARRARPLPDFGFDIGRPGRRGRSDLEYAHLCRAYIECLAEEPRRPMVLLAKKTGLDTSQLQGALYQARRRDLLTNAEPGKPGGQLTTTALKLLGNAWARATTEQRANAIEREQRFAELDEALTQKQITAMEHGERYAALVKQTEGP